MFQLRNLASLMHLFNGVASGIGAVVGYFLTRQLHSQPVEPIVAMMVFLVTVCVSSAGFIINDIYDLQIDMINRPDRPLPAKLFSVRQAWIILSLLIIIGVLLSATINPISLVMVILICVLLIIYSLYLKKIFLIGHVVVALSGALVLPYGGGSAGNLIPTIYILPVAFLAFVGREILKTLPDIEGDRSHQVDNLATRFGFQTAAVAAISCLILSVMLLMLLPGYWEMNGMYFPAVIFLVWPVTVYLFYLVVKFPLQIHRAIGLSKFVFLLVLLPIIIGSL